ncbi:glycosyltransferase family 4 protein [Patescibacteria group bacterium]
MNFLFLNIRDTSHPLAGEPEHFVAALAEKIAARGHQVTCLSSQHHQGHDISAQNGITYIRRGGENNISSQARQFWNDKASGTTDYVAETVNHKSFATSSYVPANSRIIFVHQKYNAKSSLDKQITNKQLKPHRHDLVFTTSPHIYDQLNSSDFGRLYILPPGLVTNVDQVNVPKTVNPTWLYHGSLKAENNFEDILDAFTQTLPQYPTSTLWVINNEGPTYRQKIVTQAAQLGINNNIRWYSKLSPAQLAEQYQRAWAIISTAPSRGWNAPIYDAANYKTPSIVYNLPGLAESIEHDQTGLCVTARPHDLAAAMLKLIKFKNLRKLMGHKAGHFAKHFDWHKTANRFLDAIQPPE